MKSKKLIFIPLALACGLNAYATNWVSVQTKEYKALYMDTDSASRNGDLATIELRVNENGYDKFTFDCVRKTYHSFWGQIGNTERPIPSEYIPIFEKACKRKYEFWK